MLGPAHASSPRSPNTCEGTIDVRLAEEEGVRYWKGTFRSATADLEWASVITLTEYQRLFHGDPDQNKFQLKAAAFGPNEIEVLMGEPSD